MELKHYVGIDVSKETLDFAVSSEGKMILQLQCENNRKGIVKAVKQLRKLDGFAISTTRQVAAARDGADGHLLGKSLLNCGRIELENTFFLPQRHRGTERKIQISEHRTPDY